MLVRGGPAACPPGLCRVAQPGGKGWTTPRVDACRPRQGYGVLSQPLQDSGGFAGGSWPWWFDHWRHLNGRCPAGVKEEGDPGLECSLQRARAQKKNCVGFSGSMQSLQ